MRFNQLNDDNYIMFAIKHYDNPQCVTRDDFFEDLKRFKYIKRLFKRYLKTGQLKTHLLLNHFIILYNVFGEAATPLLFFKMEKVYWSILKTFLVYLDRLSPALEQQLIEIPIDENCRQELRDI
jgi:hypothetical protein